MQNSTSQYINYHTDVKAEEIEWLWYPYIPYGKITLFLGDGGVGKTFTVSDIIKSVTTGDLLPECDTPPVLSTVIYQNAEDGKGDTIKPRLQQLGADLSRVIAINDDEVQLSLADSRIEQAIRDNKARLLILDPLQAFLGANIDMHRANEVRPLLKRLGTIAERTKCAIILVGHLNKGSDNQSQYRGLGSVDIPAAARSVLTFGKIHDEDNPDLFGFAHTKSNIAYKGISIAYELSFEKGFNWIGAWDISVDELLRPSPKEKGRPSIMHDKAKEFLKMELTGKEIPAKEIYELAEKKNISTKTLKRVKKDMKIKSFKRDKAWYWTI